MGVHARRSGVDHGHGAAAGRAHEFGAGAIFDWLEAGALVEDHQPSAVEAEAGEVSVELAEALGRGPCRVAPDLELQGGAVLAEAQAQVDAAAADGVFAGEHAAAVLDAVQEGHETRWGAISG
jgi:hypothetical protein